MPETVMVRSSWTKRLVPVPAMPTSVPGLWVGRHPGGGYVIAHKPGESVIGRYADAEAALACALELGAFTDWAVITEPSVHMPMATIRKIDAVVRRWGGNGIEVARRADR